MVPSWSVVGCTEEGLTLLLPAAREASLKTWLLNHRRIRPVTLLQPPHQYRSRNRRQKRTLLPRIPQSRERLLLGFNEDPARELEILARRRVGRTSGWSPLVNPS